MEMPEISEFGTIFMPKTETHLLDNGVTVKTAPYESSEICRFHIIMKGGTLDYENPMIPRLAALSLFRGTPNMSHNEVASKFDFCGVNVEKRVSTHHTIFDFTVLKRLAAEILPVIAESLVSPVFEPEFIEILKRNQSQAISQVYEQPKSLAMLKFKEFAYSSESGIGKSATPEGALEVTITDIIDAHRQMMANGAIIVASGDITGDIINEVNKHFGTNKFTPLLKSTLQDANSIMPNQGESITIDRENAVQSSIVMGLPAPGRNDEDFIDARIACSLFGGFFGSRLMQAIREEDGLTYGISSQITSIDGIGRMIISTDCDITYTERVKEAIVNEIVKMRTSEPTTDEMKILKSYLLSQYARMVDKSMDTGDYLTSQIIMDINPNFFNQQVTRTKEITPEQILKIAQKYFIPENILTVIVTKVS